MPTNTRAFRHVPITIGALLIGGLGYATSVTEPAFQINGQQIPPKTDTSQVQNKATPIVPTVALPLEPITGITFANESGVTYVVARSLAEKLGLEIELDAKEKVLTIGDKKFEGFRRLYAGDVLFAVRDIAKFEGTIIPSLIEGTVSVETNGLQFDVVVGKKRVEVDKAAQELTGFQGDVVVIKTNVSTGMPGHNTPVGEFKTGPKERMHYSRKYNNAEMPYAVQVNGDIFFHGAGSVPYYPASHGCIRIPLGRKNPAKYLYNWVDRGVDVKISGKYEWVSRRSKKRRSG